MHLRMIWIGLVSLALGAQAWGLEPGVATPAGYREDRIIVGPAAGSGGQGALRQLHAALGSRVMHTFRNGAGEVVELPRGLSVSKALERFRGSGAVEFAEPDYLVRPLVMPNDFHFTNQDLWNLHNTGIYGGVPGADVMAPEAWDLRTDASNIIVAVIDSGVRTTHQDLAANLWVNPGESGTDAQGRNKRTNGVDDDGNGYIDDVHGINVLNGSGNPWDDWGHGTHVAGIVGAVGNNGIGVVGVAWRVKIMACKFITGDGQYSVSDAIKCLDYARTHGAKIVTASWGGYAFQSTALRNALTALRNAGIIVAAAAGNDNNNNDVMPLYPASYDLDNIVAVAATDRTDARAAWSNYGAMSVDLGAPGAPVFSTFADSDSAYRYYDGTSMAAPHIAGACALLMARFPGETHQQIIQRVLANVDVLPSLTGRTKTNGRLNVAAALASGTPPPPPPPSAPAAPSGLSATAASSTSISVAWTDNASNETGFEIERSTNNSSFVAAGTAGANASTATVGGLTAGTTYYFRVRAMNGSAASAYSNVASATTPSGTTPPPSGTWSSQDIGAVAAAGSSSETNGTVTLRGSGADIWDGADEFHFRYQSFNGDGEIVARVTGLTNTNGWAKVGVMFRESLAANSRHALMCVTPDQIVAFQRRAATGGASASTAGSGWSGWPKWLRLVRAGTTFTAYESNNGTSWTQVGTATVAMGSAVYVGLAVTSHNDGTICTATVDSVAVTGGGSQPPPPPPPPPSGTWTGADVGSVGAAGSHEVSGSSVTVRGSGADIWENADAFRFVYRTLSGDGTIEAQVGSITNTNAWAKAGVMIRESLAANARNVFALVTPQNGVAVQARTTTGGNTSFAAGPWGAAAPYWVRLVRTGANVAAYVSADRATWTLLNTYALGVTGNVYVGLAVTAHDNAQMCTGVFNQVVAP